MNIDINYILNQDDKIHHIIESSYTRLIKVVLSSKYANTAKVFTSILNRTNFIKGALFDLVESENTYSVNILFRSLIEHYLIFQYIHTRWVIEKNDLAGDEYFRHLDMKESIDYCRSLNYARESFLDEEPIDIIESLSKIDQRFCETEKKEIDEVSKKFQYKNIINFLSKNIPNLEKDKFLKDLIPRYAELSSFIHGGPFAEKEFLKMSNINERHKYLIYISEMTFLISKSIKELTYLFAFTIDESFKHNLEELGKCKF